MKELEVGDRVYAKSFKYKGKGTVIFIDSPNFFTHETFPVQVEMDKPDDAGHTFKRFSIEEIKPI